MNNAKCNKASPRASCENIVLCFALQTKRSDAWEIPRAFASIKQGRAVALPARAGSLRDMSRGMSGKCGHGSPSTNTRVIFRVIAVGGLC